MKDLTEVLAEIDEIVTNYDEGVFMPLNDAHRKLSSNMYWLIKHQIEFNAQWNAAYHNYREPEGKTSAASKERHADKQVPELYTCRKIWEAAKNVSIAIGYERQTD